MDWEKLLAKDLASFKRVGEILIDLESEDEIYDPISQHYDKTRPKIPESLFSILTERGIIHREGTLDLACGTGRNSVPLAARHGIPVVGVDISLPMLKLYHEKLSQAGGGDVLLLKGDASALPLRDRSVDACMAFSFFHLTARYREILTEIRRILKPGGRLVTAGPAIVPEPGRDPGWFDKVWEHYHAFLEAEGAAKPSTPGPSGKELRTHLLESFTHEELRDPSLIQEESYPMKRFLFEVENRTNSNLARIDPETNRRATANLREKLGTEYGPGYESLVHRFKGEWKINVFRIVS